MAWTDWNLTGDLIPSGTEPKLAPISVPSSTVLCPSLSNS